MSIPGLPRYYDPNGLWERNRSPDRAAQRLYALVLKLHHMHVENPLLRSIGFPGVPGDINDAGTVVSALEHAKRSTDLSHLRSTRQSIRGRRKIIRKTKGRT